MSPPLRASRTPTPPIDLADFDHAGNTVDIIVDHASQGSGQADGAALMPSHRERLDSETRIQASEPSDRPAPPRPAPPRGLGS